MQEPQILRAGLEGVIACETEISWLDVAAEQIVVRGYDLIELARKVRYIDTASLLVEGRLPDLSQRDQLESLLRKEGELPEAIFSVLACLAPHTHMMDVLRTGISALSGYDPALEDRSGEANRGKAWRLLAKLPSLVANGYRIRMGEPILHQHEELDYCANFLYMMTGNIPAAYEVSAFDQSLIAYSEHEMPNSTFTARVIASTQADMFGALVGAAASLKGTLHGGANEAVMRMLLKAQTEAGVERDIKDKLKAKERIMGFGHRVYMRKMDPRASLMKEALLQLSRAKGDDRLYRMCERGERTMFEEKGLYPNLDYYAAPVYYLLGIPIDLYTPIFLAARTAGIGAHVIEQHDRNRLFRPRVLYTGERGLHP